MVNADDYFEKADISLREVALELRKIVKNHSNSLKEEIKWNVPTYSLNKNICSIMIHKKHVNFQIFNGAHIIDSKDLSGSGKDMRHLKLSSLNEINHAKLKKYLNQAIKIDK